jgi:hypothetical protein
LCFLDCDVDAAEPRSVHSQEGYEVRTRINYSDTHACVELFRLSQRR